MLFIFLFILFILCINLLDTLILSIDLFLKLGNKLDHTLEVHFQLSNLITSFIHIFTIEISITTDCLIQVLLLLKAAFSFNILLLKSCNQIILELNLLKTFVIVSVCNRSFNTIFTFIFFQQLNRLSQLFSCTSVTLNFVFKLALLIR